MASTFSVYSTSAGLSAFSASDFSSKPHQTVKFHCHTWNPNCRSPHGVPRSSSSDPATTICGADTRTTWCSCGQSSWPKVSITSKYLLIIDPRENALDEMDRETLHSQPVLNPKGTVGRPCTQRLTGAFEGRAQGGGGRKCRSSTGTQQAAKCGRPNRCSVCRQERHTYTVQGQGLAPLALGSARPGPVWEQDYPHCLRRIK